MVDSTALAAYPEMPRESLEALVDEYDSLSGTLPAAGPIASGTLYPLLLLRDRIAVSIRNGKSLPLALAGEIAGLDGKLRIALDRIAVSDTQTLCELRNSIQPPEGNWWWFQEKAPSRGWTIGSVAFLTFSVTLITDFTHRILASDPGGIGIFSVAAQALLAVGATSTFTEGGRQWLEGMLSRRKVPRRYQPASKLALMVVLFSVVLSGWETIPGLLAWYYNKLGANRPHSQQALGYFQRAAALSPEYVPANFNLGAAYEDSFEYNKAIAAYEETLVLDPADVAAYSNLSRVFVIANQPLNALRAADNGVRAVNQNPLKNPTDDELQTIATLHKNRAWAEFQLGFYSAAEADVALAAQNKAVAPAAWCVLGRIYTEQHEPARARDAWQKFRGAVASTKAPSMIEPDCMLLEETSLNEGK